jgi:hypothetical protein
MVSMKRAAKDGTFRNQTMLCCTGRQIASQPRDDQMKFITRFSRPEHPQALLFSLRHDEIIILSF